MPLEIPKFHETLIPILDILKDGKAFHITELEKRVIHKYYSDLPQELLDQKTDTGYNRLMNRIRWGKAYLKQAKMVEQPERAMVQITAKGRAVLERGVISLKELREDPEYRAHQKLIHEKNDETLQDVDENATPEERVESGINIIEAQVKGDLLEKLKSVDPYYFEKVVLQLLKKMGYGDFQETSKSRDGGIDGIINQDQLGLEKIYVQAKRYKEGNFVHEMEIRNFIGAMSGDTNKGIFVTTSAFDESALKKAREAQHKIILIDGKKLVELMHDFGVGVQVRSTYEIKEIDEDFFVEG